MSPLSQEELLCLQQNSDKLLSEVICALMRNKLIRRTMKQKGVISEEEFEEEYDSMFEDEEDSEETTD